MKIKIINDLLNISNNLNVKINDHRTIKQYTKQIPTLLNKINELVFSNIENALNESEMILKEIKVSNEIDNIKSDNDFDTKNSFNCLTSEELHSSMKEYTSKIAASPENAIVFLKSIGAPIKNDNINEQNIELDVKNEVIINETNPVIINEVSSSSDGNNNFNSISLNDKDFDVAFNVVNSLSPLKNEISDGKIKSIVLSDEEFDNSFNIVLSENEIIDNKEVLNKKTYKAKKRKNIGKRNG